LALEDLTGTKYIDDLVSSNPVGATDPKSEGDDHIRGIKNVLKTTFPNIDAEVTPTPAEINLLGSQEGGFLLKAISTGAGTADAITADFTPNITLTDGVTVIVRAQGANTISNPTFAPDGLTAKTIVKDSNAALAIGDIAGASHEIILKYNFGNDNWALLNPASGGHPSAVSGYDRGVTVNLKDDADYSTYAVQSNVTVTTWESIGPTGSGADNIWAGLDVVPLTASHLKLRAYIFAEDSTAAYRDLIVRQRETGGATNDNDNNIVEWYGTSPGNNTVVASNETDVALDSANTFEIYWTRTTVWNVAELINIQLKGWIE